MKQKQIAFKVSDEKMLEIGKEAQRKGQTIAGLVRQFVYERLEQEQHHQAA